MEPSQHRWAAGSSGRKAVGASTGPKSGLRGPGELATLAAGDGGKERNQVKNDPTKAPKRKKANRRHSKTILPSFLKPKWHTTKNEFELFDKNHLADSCAIFFLRKFFAS